MSMQPVLNGTELVPGLLGLLRTTMRDGSHDDTSNNDQEDTAE